LKILRKFSIHEVMLAMVVCFVHRKPIPRVRWTILIVLPTADADVRVVARNSDGRRDWMEVASLGYRFMHNLVLD
jgi:hypothetical protein